MHFHESYISRKMQYISFCIKLNTIFLKVACVVELGSFDAPKKAMSIIFLPGKSASVFENIRFISNISEGFIKKKIYTPRLSCPKKTITSVWTFLLWQSLTFLKKFQKKSIKVSNVGKLFVFTKGCLDFISFILLKKNYYRKSFIKR